MLEELSRLRKTFSVYYEWPDSVWAQLPVAVVTIYDDTEGVSEYRASSLLLALEREKAYRESKAGGYTWAS